MKINKTLFIAAGALTVAGAVISGAAIMMISKSNINTEERVTKEITEKISKIDISSDIANINIAASDTDKIILDYSISGNREYEVKTDNNTLSMKHLPYKNSKLKWYDYFLNIDFHSKQYYDINLTLPEDFSAHMLINSKYGDIDIAGVNGSIKVTNNCGDVKIADGEFSSFDCGIDYGDAEIERISADNINIVNDCGDIEIERIKSGSITMENRCGDIEGTISGNEEDYTIESDTRLGDNSLRNSKNGEKTLKVKNNMGDIDINFVW